ncbi:Protein of unknown function, partial [Gryllus bimaculatus]
MASGSCYHVSGEQDLAAEACALPPPPFFGLGSPRAVGPVGPGGSLPRWLRVGSPTKASYFKRFNHPVLRSYAFAK